MSLHFYTSISLQRYYCTDARVDRDSIFVLVGALTLKVGVYRVVTVTVPTTEIALYRVVTVTVPTTEIALNRVVTVTVPTTETV